MMLITYIILFSYIMSRIHVYCVEYDDVVRLRSDVLKGYDKIVRPLRNQSEIMHVNITYDIGGIHEINEVEGTMTVFMLFYYGWIDERIRWNPVYYNNTYSLLLPADSVWKPELDLIIPADTDMSIESSMNTVRFFPNGAALWYPTSVIKVSCDINIEFYPFDTQKCPIMFMIIDYFSTELALHPVNIEASLIYYIKNGIWDLVQTEAYAEKGGIPLYTVNLTVKRKPMFDIIIVIVPIMLLSFMSIMVFILPVESGERMSYSITLLLALVVFLTIISDNIPKTSSPISILSYFIGLHVLLSAFISLATILNLRLYYKDDQDPIPSWLCYCCRKRDGDHLYDTTDHGEHTKRTSKPRDLYHANGTAYPDKPFVLTGQDYSKFKSRFNGRDLNGNNWQFRHKRFDDERSMSRSTEDASTSLTWKDISRIADWIMFIISIVYFVVVFVVFALVAVFRS